MFRTTPNTPKTDGIGLHHKGNLTEFQFITTRNVSEGFLATSPDHHHPRNHPLWKDILSFFLQMRVAIPQKSTQAAAFAATVQWNQTIFAGHYRGRDSLKVVEKIFVNVPYAVVGR